MDRSSEIGKSYKCSYHTQGLKLTKAWTDAIRTTRSLNKDGTEWNPTKHSIICAQHFVSGAPSLGK